MRFTEQKIKGVWIIEPRRFGDARGYFMESFKREEFESHIGVVDFVQDYNARQRQTEKAQKKRKASQKDINAWFG